MARRAEYGDSLDKAYDRLETLLPDRLAHALHWVHQPSSRYVRMPLGVFFIVGSFFFILPVIGLEWLPLGLLLIAQDIPVLRQPVGKAVLPLIGWVERQKEKWAARRAGRPD